MDAESVCVFRRTASPELPSIIVTWFPSTFSTIPMCVLVDVFCMGCSVWSVWLIGVSIIFAAVPPAHVYTAFYSWLEVGGVLVLLWSAYVDYCFFHEVLRCSGARARRVLLVHRLLSWIPILLVISLPAIVPAIVFFAGR